MVTGSAASRRRGVLRLPSLRWVNLSGAAFLVALAALWQLAVAERWITSQYLPEPTAIARSIGDLAQSGALTHNFSHTLYVTLVGWVASGVLGVALGLALGLSAVTWRYSMASIEFLRALPAISFVPVAVLLLGFSTKMELVVVIYVSLWPILIGTIHGARQVTPMHRDLARMMHMSRMAQIRRLVLPTIAPFVFVGLQVSLSLSLALALVAEMVGNPVGVGQALIVAQNTLHPPEMFAYVVLVGIIGVLLNALFLRLVAWAFPGTSSAARAAS
jgi:ABC-type nitrate/sulfonate/bicarbonate transport system permease component